MNTLVVYDSKFGNTRQIAEVIAETLKGNGFTRLLPLDRVTSRELESVDLLVLGGPTQRRGLSPAMAAFFQNPYIEGLAGLRAVVFDTRYQKSRWLTGSAAQAIAQRLKKAGALLIAPPESFFVADRTGPLKEGEAERAAKWIRALSENLMPAAAHV